MKENKNIERLFQEKFKDFEAIPPQDAWNNIEARLENKKKKRRVLPFWLKPAGIAAGIAIAFGVFSLFNDGQTINGNQIKNDNSNSVVNQEKEFENNTSFNKLNTTLEKEANSSEGLNKIIREDEVVTEASIKESPSSNKNNFKYNTKSNSKNSFNNSQDRLVFENNSKIGGKNSNRNYLNTSNNLLPNEERDGKNALFYNEKNELVSSTKKEKSFKNKEGLILEEKAQIDFNTSVFNELISNDDNEELVENNLQKNISRKHDLIEGENQINNQIEGLVFDEIIIDTLKINQVLAENIEETKDSTQVVENSSEKEENELEKLLKEKEEGNNADEKEEEKRNKWVVSTNAAPVYFNSFNDDSPLDEQFNSNNKSYNNSISYGVGLEYNVSKKIAIRSGVNKYQMNYDTHDVYYTTLLKPDMNSAKMNSLHVNRKTTAENMMLYKKTTNVFADVDNFSNEEKGNLNQHISYIEVPLELSYKVLDKKFGVDIIGGMSTLFLQENKVSLKSSGLQMKIGEANNLNNVNFSGNLGLGFRYKFWKSFNANFQPILKYQFNTFSENSGNFKPYIIGLYTGLSYSF